MADVTLEPPMIVVAEHSATAEPVSWQAGAISRETMFDLFRRGEVLPAGRSDEEEKRLAAKDHKAIQHPPIPVTPGTQHSTLNIQ